MAKKDSVKKVKIDQVSPEAVEAVEASSKASEDASNATVHYSDEYIALMKTKGELHQIKPVIEELLRVQNLLYSDYDNVTAHSMDSDIDDLVGRYTNVSRDKVFKECQESADGAMLHAVKVMTYKSIRIKDERDSDTDILSRTIEDVDRDIDLLALNKFVKGGIGEDKNWHYHLQKLNYLTAIKVGRSIGDSKWAPENIEKIRSSFLMHEIAESFEFGEADPVSNTSMLKTLNAVIEAMIGKDYKTTSRGVAYLAQTYSRRGKKGCTVQLPSHKTFVLLLRDICHEAVTKCGFEAISKCMKDK